MSLRQRSDVDRLFAIGLLVQWVAVFAATWAISGRAVDLFFPVVVGAAIAAGPTLLLVWRPDEVVTRHVVAVAQMLFGVLAVHLTGGKLGTPFHVFASLALLALYRDGRVLVSAAAVVAVDTIGVGLLRSEIDPVRWVQELGWVAATATCLVIACRHSRVTLMAPSASAPTLRPTPIHEAAVYSDLESDHEMGEVLDAFVQRLRRTATALEAPLANAELREVANRLRGAAASYGFRSISEAAAALEDALREGGDIAPRAAALASLCRRARFRAFLRAA